MHWKYIFLDLHNIIIDRQLFPVSSQYKNYTKIISELIKYHKDSFSSCGKCQEKILFLGSPVVQYIVVIFLKFG